MIDQQGFRAAIGVIIVNDQQQLFWAKRIGQDAWQFPQGGMHEGETPEEAMFRELHEEVGLERSDVKILASSQRWLRYRLPQKLIRRHSTPVCVGQKQKWFLLKLVGPESHINFDASHHSPEFDGWRWISYWEPLKHVIHFKRRVYRMALKEFASIVLQGEQKRHSRGYLGRAKRRIPR